MAENDHIPKYAAGGDMDRLTRNRTGGPKKGPPIWFYIILIAFVTIVVQLTGFNPISASTIKKIETEAISSNPPITDSSGQITGDVVCDITKLEHNSDFTTEYATINIWNRTNVTISDVTVTITAYDQDKNVIYETTKELSDNIIASDSYTFIESFSIPEGTTSVSVGMNTHYKAHTQ